MNLSMNMRYLGWVPGVILAVVLLAGCARAADSRKAPPTASPASPGPVTTNAISSGSELIVNDKLTIGETLTVTFADAPVTPSTMMVTVKEDGSITLLFLQSFRAVGKTIGALETEIREAYVPSYYKNLTVTIQRQALFYHVGGEVRGPNRFQYVAPTTVLKAIQSAGDFTDFARRRKVALTRADGTVKLINAFKAQKDPKLDLPVFPGDDIYVPRKIFPWQ